MSETLLAAWWQVLAVGATTVVAAAVAIWGIQSQRAITRRVATLQYLAAIDADRDLIEARITFIKEAHTTHGLAQWADPGKEHTDECQAIRLVLNELELASVAIQLGTMDAEMYRRYNYGTVIRYWYAASPYIYSLRRQTGSKTVYHEFEELARWFESGRPPARHFLLLKLR
jgi:hypothetical protein